MADGTKARIDVSEWNSALALLKGADLRSSLARSMGVAGGTIIRDEAAVRAPRSDRGPVSDVGPRVPLADSIYLAYRDASTPKQAVYAVSWNSKLAPHGHLVEFGHWSRRGKRPKRAENDNRPAIRWVPAHPFLRPAFDSSLQAALNAMYARGKERLPELLAGKGSAGENE